MSRHSLVSIEVSIFRGVGWGKHFPMWSLALKTMRYAPLFTKEKKKFLTYLAHEWPLSAFGAKKRSG